MGNIDHTWTSEAVCPHCGYEYDDTSSVFDRSRFNEIDVECVECGKSFEISRDFDVTYYTKKIEK